MLDHSFRHAKNLRDLFCVERPRRPVLAKPGKARDDKEFVPAISRNHRRRNADVVRAIAARHGQGVGQDQREKQLENAVLAGGTRKTGRDLIRKVEQGNRAGVRHVFGEMFHGQVINALAHVRWWQRAFQFALEKGTVAGQGGRAATGLALDQEIAADVCQADQAATFGFGGQRLNVRKARRRKIEVGAPLPHHIFHGRTDRAAFQPVDFFQRLAKKIQQVADVRAGCQRPRGVVGEIGGCG